MVDNNKKSGNTNKVKNENNAEDRISGISNVTSTILKMQKDLDKQSKTYTSTDEENVKLQSSMIKMLGSVSKTIAQVGTGITKVAAGSVEAGKDVLSQYGKSISQDISIDKQNVVAMALSKTSPLFGYFASKFMETDVFKSAAGRMKKNISNALGEVTSKFKLGFGNFFSSIKFKSKKDKPIKTINVKEKTKPPKLLEIPKMQKGGVVEKAGLAKIHAAEVVMPIDKLLSRIDKSISTTKDLAAVSKSAQLKTLANMGTYVKGVDNLQKVGMFKGFINALKESNTQYTEPANKRMLRAVLSIQDSMGATVGTWPQVWQKMLIDHPTFRSIVFSLKTLKSVIGIPGKFIYSFFKTRGGYKSHLSHSKNPSVAAAENVGLLYTGGMWRLDNIARFTRATAEATRDMSTAITGKKYPQLEGISTGVYSLFGFTRKLTNLTTKYTLKLLGKSKLGDTLTKERLLIGRFGRKREMFETYGKSKDLQGHLKYGSNENKPLIESINGMSNQNQICCSNTEIRDNKSMGYSQDIIDISKKDYTAQITNNRKMIGYTKDIVEVGEDNLKIQKKMNKRDRFRMIMDRFKNTKLGGLLSLATTFLIPFLFKGGMKKMIGSVLKKFGKTMVGSLIKNLGASIALKLFPKGVKVAIMRLGPILARFAGPFAMLAGAGILGWKLGKQLDKVLGISEKFNKTLDTWDKKVNKSASELSKKQSEMFKTATGGYAPTVERFAAKRKVKLQTLIGSASEERQKSLGYFGRSNIYEINLAQQKYMNENISDYLKYSYENIQQIREKWLERGYSGKAIGADSTAYGMRREKSFLRYLKKNGTLITDIETSSMFKTYEDTWNKRHKTKALINKYTKAGYAVEGTIKGSKVLTQTVQDIVNKYITKGKLKEGMSDIEQRAMDLAIVKEIQDSLRSIQENKKLISELKEQGKQALESSKESAGKVLHGLVHTTNNISTSIQNSASTVSNAAAAGATKFSETTQAILQGA